MKINYLKKGLLAVLIASLFAILTWFVLGNLSMASAYAEGNTVSSADGLVIDGPVQVYRDENVEYSATSNNDFTFIQFSVDCDNIEKVEESENSVVLHIKEEAILYSVFTLTAIDQISGEIATLQIMVLPVYASNIGEVSLSVNNIPLDKDEPIVEPGNKVNIQIKSFIVDEEVYGIADNVTYSDFAVVIDSTAEGCATVDDKKDSIIITNHPTKDNPVVKFTIVVIQHKADPSFQNLTKVMELKVNIPVKSLTVETNGTMNRGNVLEYSVRYNENNIASVKGYTLSSEKLDGSTVDYSRYFEVNQISNYKFQVRIDKKATYGAGIKLTIESDDNPQAYKKINIVVGLLESGYSVVYSKDYQGTTNNNNGIQLVEKNGKVQLRNGYNADFHLLGQTTGKKYTIDELQQWGVNVGFTYTQDDNFQILNKSKITVKDGAPAHTDNQRTSYSFQIDITDGTKKFDTIKKSVEVFRSLGTSKYSSFYLSGVQNSLLTKTSYDIVFSLQGSNFTAKSSDITFTSSDSAIYIIGKSLGSSTPGSVGDTITITAKSSAYYNNVNVDANWQHSITVKRRFVASQSQLAKLKNASKSDTYYIINDIYMSGSWTPIPFNGILEGQYYTIYNMNISQYASSSNPYGLFSENIGQIKNIKLSNYSINISSSGSTFIVVGAIVGFNSYEACIYDCEAESGTITVNHYNSHVGSIVGQNQGLVYNCFVNSGNTLKGYGHLGGIAGENTAGGVVQSSTSYTKIYYTWNTANKSIGGVVGYNDSNSTVTYCYFGGYIEWKCTNTSTSIKPEIGYIIGRNLGSYSNCNKIASPTKLIECKSSGQSTYCFKVDGEKVGRKG